MKIKAKHFLIMLACSTCLASCALGNGAPSGSEDTAVSESSYDETKSLNNLEFKVISEDEKTIEVKGYKIYYGDFRDWEEIVIPKTVNGYRVVAIGEFAFDGYHTSYKDSKTCAALRKLKKILIPSSVTSIGRSAFLDCSSLSSISIPEGVTSIGDSAFEGCSSLTSISIPEGVTSIGDGAFSGCPSLESIAVDPANPFYRSAGNCLIETASKKLVVGCKASVIPVDGSVTSIGGSAFEGCSSLTSISIPYGVTSIGGSAFYCCSLDSVSVHSSVTSIGNYAFAGNLSLCELQFFGTTTQWKAVKKGAQWRHQHLVSVVCSDGTIYPD